MRIILTTFIVLISSVGFSQKGVEGEALSPLGSNHVLIEKNKGNLSKSVDGLFVYKYDTLKISGSGLIDDFTTDKFKPLDAKPGDPKVTDTSWFHLYQSGVPDTMVTEYMNDTTYWTTVDTVPGYGFDSLITILTAIPSVPVEVYDICVYPPTFYLDTLWPNDAHIDSLWTTGIDLSIKDGNPDFVQDSVIVYKVDTSAADANYMWIDKYVYKNNTYAINPPSYGVATFDGLDETGYPYNFNSSTPGLADVLTSIPIDLQIQDDNVTPWVAEDSLELSFWYQAQGLGNAPENNDTLVVQFWSPSDEKWSTVWKANGVPLDTFERAAIKIISINYLLSGFQFRFKNYGALNGSLDHWHIDFVHLRSNLLNDTVLHEIAIQDPINTLLKEYTAMPYTHFEAAPTSSMNDTILVEIVNSDQVTVNVTNVCFDVFNGVDSLTSRCSDNANHDTYGQTDSTVAIDYFDVTWFEYDTTLTDTSILFDVKFRFNPGINFVPTNKSYWLKQRFTNFYAYDDGTAEVAYGITGTQPKLAYRFTSPIEDSLHAIKIHFEPAVNDVSNDPFILMVWDNDGAGGTPGSILYEEPLLMKPKYNIGVNGFYTYVLSEKVATSGTYYVGWKQTTTNRLNIGMDLNIDNGDKIYYDVSGGTWANTSFQGSLMMRPVYDAAQPSGWVSVREVQLSASVYPNPANNILNVEMPSNDAFDYLLIDLNGRLLEQSNFNKSTQIDISRYESGIYILKVSDKMGNFTTVKVIKE
ncbi:MAG: T9SS type A sorting domain-containing protein [Flavobacteriales bacterium]|nr:T9SS type A sorting domain-containing protein [Flavobacteriales bacterium]